MSHFPSQRKEIRSESRLLHGTVYPHIRFSPPPWVLVLLGGNKRMIIISNQPLLSQSWICYSPNTASLFAKEETFSLFLSSVCLWPQTHLQIFYNLVFLADIPGKALTVGRSPKSTEMEASGFVIDCQQQRQMLGFMYNRNCQTKRMILAYLLRQLKKNPPPCC